MWLAGGIAVVAAGLLVIALAVAEDRGRRPRATARGTVTVDELRAPDLPTAWRGYSRGHVDALLARAARTLEEARRYGDDPEGPITRTGVEATSTAAPPPSFLREELEDRGSDDAGGLDR